MIAPPPGSTSPPWVLWPARLAAGGPKDPGGGEQTFRAGGPRDPVDPVRTQGGAFTPGVVVWWFCVSVRDFYVHIFYLVHSLGSSPASQADDA